MNRLIGVGVLVVVLYTIMIASRGDLPDFKPIANTTGLYGLLTIGVGLVIITGGIDLSLGSVVALGAIGFLKLMTLGVSPPLAAAITLFAGVIIGLTHGLLVTMLRLQPFLVTLCGLFIYRGLARMISKDPLGEGVVVKGDKIAGLDPHPQYESWFETFDLVLIGRDADRFLLFPASFVWFVVVLSVAALILHGSVFGRYLYAVGHNEQAARYAGVATKRVKIGAYVICSTLAMLVGLMWAVGNSTTAPHNAGLFWELYAITGAVLGGCSLRGGEGTVPGMMLGAMVLPVLERVVLATGIPDESKYLAFGLTLLLGTIADQYFRQRGAAGKV